MEDNQLTVTEGQEITIEAQQELARFYDELDHDTREFIQAEEQDIVIVRAYADIVIGQKLARIKARLPHGQWLPYLKLRWNATERQAQTLMKIAEIFKNEPSSYLTSFDPTALKYLAYAPESARLEAKELSDSGEHISAKLAKEIAARHKAELEAKEAEAEAAKREAATKQQAITTLEDQIKALEDERTNLRKENDYALRSKAADDQAIIRQEMLVRQLTKQIDELKAQIQQPQVIEKEKIVEIEKRVEIIPEDYDSLKMDVTALKDKLQTSRQKAGEEVADYQRRINELSKNLAKKETMLAQFNIEQKQNKALSQITEAQSLLFKALASLEDDHISKQSIAETIKSYCFSIVDRTNKFLNRSNAIDVINVIDVEGVECVQSYISTKEA